MIICRVHTGHGEVQREEDLCMSLVNRLVGMPGNSTLKMESGRWNVVFLELAGPLNSFDPQKGQPQNQRKCQIDHLGPPLPNCAARTASTTVRLLQISTAVLTVPSTMSSELLPAANSG